MILIFAFVFVYLLIRFRRASSHLVSLQELQAFEERQVARKAGTYKLLETSAYVEAFKDSPLSRDLDLIGEKSLFSQINETLTHEGELYLIENILNGNTSHADFSKKIKDLKKQYFKDKRHYIKLKAGGSLLLEPLLKWAKNQPPIHPASFLSVYVGYVLFLALLLTPYKNMGLLIYLTSYIISFSNFHSAYSKALELEALLFSLKKHLRYLLKTDWISSKSFVSLRRVSTWVSFLSVQANPLVLVLLNLVFPWTAFFTHLLSRAQKSVAKEAPLLIQILKDWDYLFSIRSLYQYQTTTFASMSETHQWQAKEIFHPLLSNPKANSFDLNSLALITGSNMSGKSTFLRTIGVNQVLANMGAPVFAASLTTWPATILSCIKVSDSIENGISYFYAEALRLKAVLSKANETPCLFLIDEIFRGTNNKERYIGAKSLILSLSKGPSIGIVTTHDLDLVDLETLTSRIKNYHFHDEVRGKELYFSFDLKEGPSKTTNALQILKNVGIPILE
ncbi:MAG: hypothetical protein KDD37_02390 [Bdellovibrionales bacterium]|nr:hypothetical protein [Bdellovibrionales bacterium]